MVDKAHENSSTVKPSWGLVRTLKFGITAKNKIGKLRTTGDDYIKMDKRVFMDKDFLKNTMIVKIDFTLHSSVMLICNI
jgi:hypothetical protein